MKKIIVVLFAVVMMFAFCACGSSSDTSSDSESNDSKTEQVDTSKATVGDYDVAIKDFEVIQDDEGKDAIAVTFDFTNNSEEIINFDYALYGQCFQNGVELDFGTIYNGEDTTDPGFDNLYKEIQPGASIEVKQAFLLQDLENPVTVEVLSMNEIMGGESEGKAETEFDITK